MQKFRLDFEGARTLRLSEESIFTFKVKRYADLFDGKYRIYIPLEAGNTNDQPVTYNPTVSQEVEKAGYKIDKSLWKCNNESRRYCISI